jgi:AAA family ATP:ADP antiporter
LPCLAFGAYTAVGIIGGIAVIRAAKITENGTEYSLQNTAHQTLFLTMSRAAKYKAKAAIDTVSVRAGDLCAAALVWVAIHELELSTRQLAFANVVLVTLFWLPACIGIARRHARLAESS